MVAIPGMGDLMPPIPISIGSVIIPAKGSRPSGARSNGAGDVQCLATHKTTAIIHKGIIDNACVFTREEDAQNLAQRQPTMQRVDIGQSIIRISKGLANDLQAVDGIGATQPRFKQVEMVVRCQIGSPPCCDCSLPDR
jgi:hypothetical protein